MEYWLESLKVVLRFAGDGFNSVNVASGALVLFADFVGDVERSLLSCELWPNCPFRCVELVVDATADMEETGAALVFSCLISIPCVAVKMKH